MIIIGGGVEIGALAAAFANGDSFTVEDPYGGESIVSLGEKPLCLESIAGQGSALSRKHGLYLQYVTIADAPENYAQRLEELFPGEFIRLRLFALEVNDLILAKLVRNSPVDLEDAKFLARTGRLNETVLKQRYEKELRPYLANEKRHDLTLNLWLEACFPS